jgi:antitoxin component of MazEF toxin-antitoxin module|tara:strand:+ start:433 stop:750 length:318 start_codon:yes stop_codon:yes gene_type:complete
LKKRNGLSIIIGDTMTTQSLNRSYTKVILKYNNFAKMAHKVKVRKWGNSLGILLPKELVEKRELKNGVEILVEVVNPTQFDKIFGSLKLKRSTKEIMKEIKEGWN